MTSGLVDLRLRSSASLRAFRLQLRIHRRDRILTCYPGPNQALQPVAISVEVLHRFKRHRQMLDQPHGQIEFFGSGSRYVGAVLALTPDLGVVEECLSEDPAAAGLKITTDSRLCIVICANPAHPVWASA